ncbi:helix-turn-helix domain-containing protein [Pedobacter deserti]|uniref:helix-turn-helix domain-containing protein n=1 Tax=Pedobacter deserti TaxID=2817382 RepID=UPI002109CAED|nr:AraC family transcriptional regulator [Pedobacter sp. SYSU D00382]
MNPFILALQASNLTVEIHHHAAYQIVLSTDTPFNSTIDGTLNEGIYGFLIKPHVRHLCVAEKGTLSVLNIEPYSNLGLELSTRFKENEAFTIFRSAQEIITFFGTPEHSRSVPDVIETLISKIPVLQYDDRVATIVDYIRSNYFESDITPQTFSDKVFLSPSRLAALFKEQTGSSLSKYLLWTRLRQAIYLALTEKDKSLTEIAYETGFYDLPQLNKYMYEMFGMPPKALKMNSNLILVH